MPERVVRVGGSFAPKITSARLAEYKELARKVPEQIKDAMLALCDMVEEFLDIPPAVGTSVTPHKSGIGLVVGLEPSAIERLWNYVPWKEELEMYAALFDKLDPVTDKVARNAAFHLLWYGNELFLDREPITKDRISIS